MSTWSDMNPAQRNTLIGGLIGAEPLSQCFLAVDGKRVLMTPYAEKDRAKVDAMLLALRASDDLWQELKAANPPAQDEWRAKLEVQVERWHIAYSNTPGGGWIVLEWLVKEGFHIMLEYDREGVRMTCARPGERELHHASSETLGEAACRLLLRIKAPEALR